MRAPKRRRRCIMREIRVLDVDKLDTPLMMRMELVEDKYARILGGNNWNNIERLPTDTNDDALIILQLANWMAMESWYQEVCLGR